MKPLPEDLRRLVVEYVVRNGADMEFTKHFWRECEPLPEDISRYQKFSEAQRLLATGLSQIEVSERTGVNKNSINQWKRGSSSPKLVHFLSAYLRLGKPETGKVWLTFEQTHGHAVPVGQFIQVPNSVGLWEDVDRVISQIKPLGSPAEEFSKAYLFGFLVGMIIGDGHKPKQGRGHRHIELVLSKRYETSVKIGDFTTYAANQLGLRMERFEDIPKPARKPHGFFHWASQSSPFLDWVFNVILGLRDGQHTTYDPVQMNWVFESPSDFRVGLLQGIAESDGSVSIASQTVEFWVIPDWDLMIRLLATFGLRGFRNREAVSLVKTQAIESFKVPVFAAHLRTFRYQRLELMATTPKLDRADRIPVEIRSEIMRLAADGQSIPKIVEAIARLRSLLVSFEAAQRWANKAPLLDESDDEEPAKKENK